MNSKFAQKYKVLKLLCSDYKINCYIATKNDIEGEHFDKRALYLVNEICDRSLINHYLGDIMDCDTVKVPEFVEYFSENSKLYVVFAYHQGTALSKALDGEKLPVKMRVALLKNILHNMISQGSYPNVVKTNALHIENINFDDNSIVLNYRFFSVETEPESSGQVFMAFDRLLSGIFSGDEIAADSRLEIISDKCNKGIYHSFGEVMKDLEDAERVVDEKASKKEALVAKKNQLRGTLTKIFVVLVAVAAVFVLIDMLTANKAATNIYNDLTKIGSTILMEKDEDKTYDDVYVNNGDDAISKGDVGINDDASEEVENVGVLAGDADVDGTADAADVDGSTENSDTDVEEVKAEDVAKVEVPKQASPKFVYVDPNLFFDEHTIQPGQTLMGIMRDYYGDLKYYDEVIAFNKIADPSLIKYGYKLKLPIFEY